MPIYAYKCGSCGHAKDVLQKLSDDPLSVCPACGVAAFSKQLTAAGFQLKGSDWYATDFRGGNTPGPDKTTEPGAEGKTDAVKPADGAPAETTVTKPDTSAPAPAVKSDAPSASAGGSGRPSSSH